MQNLLKTTDTGMMKFTSLDAVSSVTVAEHLGVRHFDIMKSIEKAKKYHKYQNDNYRSEFHPIFKNWEYENSRGRKYLSIIMNEDAIKALIKVVDTQKAYDYFTIIMGEFNNIRLERDCRESAKALVVPLSIQVEHLQKKLQDEGSGAASHIYTIIHKQIHRATTGISMPKGGALHDRFTIKENHRLILVRSEVIDFLEKALKSKDTGREIKDSLRNHIQNKLTYEMGNLI